MLGGGARQNIILHDEGGNGGSGKNGFCMTWEGWGVGLKYNF